MSEKKVDGMSDTVLLYKDKPHRVRRDWIENTEIESMDIGKRSEYLQSAMELEEYDYILAEGRNPLYVTYIYKKLLGGTGKVIEIACDCLFDEIEGLNKYELIPGLLNHVDGVIGLSNLAKEMGKNIFNAPGVIANTYMADNRYSKLGNIKPKLDGNKVVCISENRKEKGLDLLVDACKGINVDLTIVGKGTEEYGGEGYVDDISNYLSSAAFYVQPSTYEPYAVATVEAMRAGIPALVTDMVGAKEVVKEVDKNLIVSADVNGISRGIKRYMKKDPDEKRELSRKARKASRGCNKKNKLGQFKEALDNLKIKMGGIS